MNIRSHFLKLIYKLTIALFSISFLFGCISAKQAPVPSQNEILLSTFAANDLQAVETPRGIVVYLPSVMFVLGSAQISPESADKVRFIAQVSNKEGVSDRAILIEGHTDSTGSEVFNVDLSRQRAQSVANAMIGHGLANDRAQLNWFGETRPLLLNSLSDGSDNPEGRAANRRVEIIFLNN